MVLKPDVLSEPTNTAIFEDSEFQTIVNDVTVIFNSAISTGDIVTSRELAVLANVKRFFTYTDSKCLNLYLDVLMVSLLGEDRKDTRLDILRRVFPNSNLNDSDGKSACLQYKILQELFSSFSLTGAIYQEIPESDLIEVGISSPSDIKRAFQMANSN